ncbi:fer-1-like protein 5 [Melopsittacus undulatus]|uniref:fer-1-like protein 5 n=1 Tax=Melopsittacus undulatus TaxID=13146 RepID=UPI00146A1279|nr:fer-1-like protein 5 [Melopsittacus undulatus]
MARPAPLTAATTPRCPLRMRGHSPAHPGFCACAVGTLAWPLGARPLHPTSSLSLRLRHWGQPAPQGDLGSAVVSLDQLVANPELPLSLSQVSLLDPKGQPTGCTITLRCSYNPRGKAGDATVPMQRWVPPPTVSPVPPMHPSKPPAGSKEEFQVRVRVIEGHRLQGNNIKPVVTVFIGQHRFRTRIRVGNNPYYNEVTVFCQSFHQTLEQLMMEPIRIQVLNSKSIRSKAIIGVFQLDIGTIYHAPGHSLSWKWLSLQDPRHPDAGSRGYLRVSMAVLRAGEPVPEQEEPEGDKDVEANLLQPPPCAATLQLRIYRAEDLPLAEPAVQCLPSVRGKRSFVAAAVRAGFAGRTLPPICDEIQLAILSGPRSSKVLGTATLHLSHISSAGAELEEGTPGFLPCFGPSFLPFYGPRADAARTSSTDTNVAYRGRVLLELSTHMGTPDGHQRGTINQEDIIRVQSHLPRHRFGLCGVFYSATMVPAGPELLRFELSLGNHGDTGDVTCKPAASITPHGCPVFDGNRYHYLPWYGDKPVAAVTSAWEDAAHRWDALNLLRAMCQRLEKNVVELRRAHGDTEGDIGRRLLRELAQDCRRVLLQLEAQPTPTPLDTHLRAARIHLLRRVAAAASMPPRAGWATLLPMAEAWLQSMGALAVEPQAAVPDVLLWMLRGERRVACARIPAPDIMFSRSSPSACGRSCGRLQTLFLTGSGDIHAQLRLRLWLGPVADSGALPRLIEGSLRIYAETYENQTKLWGKWGPRGLPGSPSFSDGAGRAVVPRHRIRPPKGWRWDGAWTVEPQRRLLLDTETNMGEVLEEVYENESRRPGGDWGPATVASTDASGVEVPPKEEVLCPQGWHVTDGWRVDVMGAVDEAGWEYGASVVPDSPPAAWHPTEKTYHTHRRRRWLRTRRRDPGAQGPEQDVATFLQLHRTESAAGSEAWEYGSLWSSRFHLKPRAGDVCRRRCWHRHMVPEQTPSVAPLFLLEGSPGTEEPAGEEEPPAAQRRTRRLCQPGPKQPLPLILCTFQQPNVFQLRCYIFQALELSPRGTKSTADPVAHVSFVYISQSTRVLPRTLDPLWDQTLLFHRVLLYGDPRGVQDEPPAVVVEVFDQDGGDGALEQVSSPPWRQGVFSVPMDVRPLLRPVALEVLAWGLRGLRSSVRAPSLEVHCGGRVLRTPPIPDPASNPNFPINAFLLVLSLPLDEELMPPVRLRVLDVRDFGYRPEVGQTRLLPEIISKMKAEDEAQEGEGEEEDDWWSKFYAALGDTAKSRRGTSRDRLKIYSCELEAVPEFEGLQDFCRSFPLFPPGSTTGGPGEDPQPVAELKGLFLLYPLPEDPSEPPPPRRFQPLPPSQPQRCLVRVYVVRAFELPPRDRNGLCDPYVRVSLGAQTLGQRDQYVPNTLEPVFGRLFELTGTIPLEKDLRVSLLDYDLVPPDQEIGTTTIDLENRLLSRFRAHCGLPALYCTAGPGCWRDQLSPSQTLEHFARTQGLPAPEFNTEGTAVTFGDHSFLLSHFESGPPQHQHHGVPRERLALHVLRACHLVPEHLETRTLYCSTQPGLEQGKVQMWVDVFPMNLGPPGPPVDITPRKPQKYELRCVVWNARDVVPGDTNLLGQQMSDIYIVGWLDGLEDQRQRTDVHYRSLDGSGSFNWRFVFPFEYLAAEQRCVLPAKKHFWSLDQTVLKVPPKLILQVWDNDKFSADDFLGTLELDLRRMPRPAPHARSCALRGGGRRRWGRPRSPPPVSLFRQRQARGWWPCEANSGGERRLTGKLELSLELLTAKEAAERPAGRAREEPNAYPTLPPPVRPDWSFLWVQAPLRTLRHGLWRQHRGCISLSLALLLLFALLLTFVYAAPGYLAMKLINPFQGLHISGDGGSKHPAAGAEQHKGAHKP